MESVCIEKLDNYGRGIAYVNNKITFIPNALPNEIVEIKIQNVYKKYQEATVVNYVKTSPNRVEAMCPYYEKCSGCALMHMDYEDTLTFKKKKVEDILKKYANVEQEVSIFPSPNSFSYRNKITLKVKEGRIGYYKEKSHHLVQVEKCPIASNPIGRLMTDLYLLSIQDAEIVIRSNTKEEILLVIKTDENIVNLSTFLENHPNVVGVVLNKKTIYGKNYFYEQIEKQTFKISYDAFFQINREVCSILIKEIEKQISKEDYLLDLYCGVGTLGISVGKKVSKLYGIEVIPNAIKDAKENALLNKIKNATFFCGRAEDALSKIEDRITMIILDPPREGLDKKTKNQLTKIKAEKIIYVSCDPMTLARDIKELKEIYDVKSITAFDMFPYTYHVECVTLLSLKNAGK